MSEFNKLFTQANQLLAEAKKIFADGEATAEQREQASRMLDDAKALKERGAKLTSIAEAKAEIDRFARNNQTIGANSGFKSLGEFIAAVLDAGSMKRLQVGLPLDPRLTGYVYKEEKGSGKFTKVYQDTNNTVGWGERKDLAESVGATGGFLVPDEFLPELRGVDAEASFVRQRATVIPMARRSIRIPVLDQTSTTAGQPHFFGGIVPTWTEEGASKDETDPSFRQIELVAHKLTCYTEVSDELVEDSVVSFDAFLRGPRGFAGAIAWSEEYAFLQGTGAGQPLGVLNAGATITRPRAADGDFSLEDAADMLAHFLPSSMSRGVWVMSQSVMPELLAMNGPAGNPSYVFTANVQGAPGLTLFGMPIIFTEKLPAHGTTGDILLADFSYYLVGSRQGITVESTNVYRFKNDQTSWRAVHRVDGQPWLQQPLTLQDGVTQVSPFVILGEKAS